MGRAARGGSFLPVALLLAGCTAFGANEPPPACPKVAFVYGLHAVDALPADDSELPVRAELAGIRGRCVYGPSGVELDYTFDVLVRPGSEPPSSPIEVPYFVAVLDETGAVVDRRHFVAAVPMEGPGDRTGVREHLRQTLVRADRRTGPRYRVLIGLDLPPDAALANWRARNL